METSQDDEILGLLRSPRYWLDRAWGFRTSAHVLWLAWIRQTEFRTQARSGLADNSRLEQINIAVIWMLYGLSLELLLKAIILASGRDPEYSHKLVLLAQSAGMALSVDDVAELEFLQECLIWYARYPLPKKNDALGEHEKQTRRFWEASFSYEATSVDDLRIGHHNGRLLWESLESYWRKGLDRFSEESSTGLGELGD